jgi:hypothetical protein
MGNDMKSGACRVWFSTVFLLLFTTQIWAQVMIDPRNPSIVIEGGAALYDAGKIDYAMLVADKKLMEELDLIPNQWSQMEMAMKESGMRNFQIMQSAIKSKNFEEAKLLIRDERTSFTKLANEILLPHQLKVAEMLGVMKFVSELSVPQMISAPGLGLFVDLTENEKKRIELRAREIQDELERDVNRLKFEALQKLVKELPENKQKQLESLLKAPIQELGRKARSNKKNE